MSVPVPVPAASETSPVASPVTARPARRTVLQGAAWSVPAVALAGAAPAFASSGQQTLPARLTSTGTAMWGPTAEERLTLDPSTYGGVPPGWATAAVDVRYTPVGGDPAALPLSISFRLPLWGTADSDYDGRIGGFVGVVTEVVGDVTSFGFTGPMLTVSPAGAPDPFIPEAEVRTGTGEWVFASAPLLEPQGIAVIVFSFDPRPQVPFESPATVEFRIGTGDTFGPWQTIQVQTFRDYAPHLFGPGARRVTPPGADAVVPGSAPSLLTWPGRTGWGADGRLTPAL